ncbi:MAG: PDGLE domain-containing protein [Drouetiella hepatica Uher 2000/2452]|jgi:cobalt/nickel transport protein|uniref:PDGLE domain-containing protein n=1 Tax=Drouetiella hepatica Uher 2000/2452 TaxID=904376 RepID=A0A951UMZ1_9CYAN|nr:PDGLE domain-containing protein [Drouetiella hepatica Uher 2000/2452]
MTDHPNQARNGAFVLVGLGAALAIAVFFSPFASSDPDGLDRVSQDLGFDNQAQTDTPAKKLPFYGIFEEYALRGVPEAVATPLAGLIGTLAAFGLAWGAGKLLVKGSSNKAVDPDFPDRHSH